jgi:riboflavin synthase
MFTGIIEAVGRVLSLEDTPSGARLRIDAPFARELAVGESVAVDGCCLTALPPAGGPLLADLSPETLRRTTLGGLTPGRPVNLERSVRLADRMGGHLVSGHVDGVESIRAVETSGDGRRVRISLAPDAGAFLVPQGSIAVDGISLTVAGLGPDWFEVAVIPHTLSVTSLGQKRSGDAVNVEHDLVGKYLLRAMALAGQVELGASVRRRLGLT